MLADWLSSLLSIDSSTVVWIGTFCAAGTWILRGQLSNPMLGFVIQPLLTALSVVIFALMQASGLIEQTILSDKIKGIMAATMAGHGIGIAVGMLILILVSEKGENLETELTKRAKPAAPSRRVPRRNFRESLR